MITENETFAYSFYEIDFVGTCLTFQKKSDFLHDKGPKARQVYYWKICTSHGGCDSYRNQGVIFLPHAVTKPSKALDTNQDQESELKTSSVSGLVDILIPDL
ncbi:hypothetical protein PPYR_07149 [Photinus pyralis]|uniref:Uncharacterized protein n=1 Tax=Photinus pyralis TaxID=7054 RepID=A0A5N4APL4_PHOPY|nr:hypothetical protein PPYR_07149 [Photinus pyralis]